MTFEQAAALPQAGQLAVQGLFAVGPLRSGQKILINGAGGGVGTIAIQLAKSQDVEVTGVDSAVKFEMMRAIGFDHVSDYRNENFARNGRHYDLILDSSSCVVSGYVPFRHGHRLPRKLAPESLFSLRHNGVPLTTRVAMPISMAVFFGNTTSCPRVKKLL